MTQKLTTEYFVRAVAHYTTTTANSGCGPKIVTIDLNNGVFCNLMLDPDVDPHGSSPPRYRYRFSEKGRLTPEVEFPGPGGPILAAIAAKEKLAADKIEEYGLSRILAFGPVPDVPNPKASC